MRYTYIIVKKIQVIPLGLPHLLIVHNFNSHFFCIAFKSVDKSSVPEHLVSISALLCVFSRHQASGAAEFGC